MKMGIRAYGKVSGIVLAVLIGASAMASEVVIYQPNMPNNSNPDSLGAGADFGSAFQTNLTEAVWQAHYGMQALANPDVTNWDQGYVQGAVAVLVRCSENNPYRNNSAILWTDNFSVTNQDVQNLSEIMFRQNNSLTNVTPRVALRVGGEWVVSVETYGQAVAGGNEATTLTANDLASMGWYALDFTAGSELVVDDSSTIAFSALSGHLDAAGLYYPDMTTGNVRLREFRIKGHSPVLFETHIFWQGMDGYHTFRIPALIEALDGTLLAFAEGRRNSFRDNGDIDTVLRRSHDGGYSWTPLQVVWSDEENTCGNPTVLVDHVTERVWLFMTHNFGPDTLGSINDGTSEGVRTIWSCYSDDNGATWSVPVNRFEEVQPPDTRWDATGPGNGIQLVYGPHAGRLIIPAIGRNVQSDDHGETWYQSGWLPSGTSEATVVELNNGRLYRNDRPVGGVSEHRRRPVSTSDDGGQTWSPLEIRDDLPCPRCQASSIVHDRDTLPSRLLLFSNPAKYTENPGVSHDRRLRLTVRSSTSEGERYEHSKIIFPGDAAYSSLASMGDGRIALLYENGDDWPYRRITFARFTADWIEDPVLLDIDFSAFQPGESILPASYGQMDKGSYGFETVVSDQLQIVDGSGLNGDAGRSAVRIQGDSAGIRVPDLPSRGLLNIDRDMSMVIRIVFRTTAHQEGGANSSGSLVAKDVGPNQPSWWIRVQDGLLRFLIDDGGLISSVTSDQSVSDGEWHEAVVLRDVEKRRLYLVLNGRLAGEAHDGTQRDLANESALVIGAFNNGQRRFSGDIDRVEIQRVGVFPPAAELLARYPFQGSLADSVGVNHGVAVPDEVDFVPGPFGTDVLEANGTRHIELPLETAFPRSGTGRGLDRFTLMAWVRPESFSALSCLLGVYNDDINTALFVQFRTTGAVRAFLRADEGNSITLTTPGGALSAQHWHHLAVTYNGATMRIFVDGQQVASGARVLRDFSPWQYPVTLLARNLRSEIDQPFTGQVSELRFYNEAMSATEIQREFYRQWLEGRLEEDDRGDGMINLIAYALGAGPVESAWDRLPFVASDQNGRIRFVLPSASRDNLYYQVRTTEDLNSPWHRMAFKEGGAPWGKDPEYAHADRFDLLEMWPGVEMVEEEPDPIRFFQLRVSTIPEDTPPGLIELWTD